MIDKKVVENDEKEKTPGDRMKEYLEKQRRDKSDKENLQLKLNKLVARAMKAKLRGDVEKHKFIQEKIRKVKRLVGFHISHC